MPFLHSPFRPRHEPAATFYDVFQLEAAKRHGRTVEAWCRAELEAMHGAASSYALQRGFTAPTVDEVARAEIAARGHVDYGSKWAMSVAAHFPMGPTSAR